MRKMTCYAVVVVCFFIFCSAEVAFSSGSLEVTISPQNAIDAGAQWRHQWMEPGTWLDSGIQVEIPAGSIRVEFKPVTGWTPPAARYLTIRDGQPTSYTGIYTQPQASLYVTIIPDEAVLAGAQWRVDGGAWTNSGYSQKVSVGVHQLQFRPVEGWIEPTDKEINVIDTRTKLVTEAYIPRIGSLQVFIEPEGARIAGAQWRHQWMEPGAWLNSGVIEDVPAGPCRVEFKGVWGWAEPAFQMVDVVEQVLTTATGTYVALLPSITVTVPNGGENWPAGTTQTIRWTYVGSVGTFVRIELLKGGVLTQTIISSFSIGTGGSGSYSWAIPSTQALGNDYQVKVTSTTNSAYTDTSDANFTINPVPGPSITVATPNGGENWAAGTTQTISWTYTGNPGNYVKIQLFKGGVLYRQIISSRSIGTGGSGSYPWAIPSTQPGGSDYQIKVTSTTNSAYTDTSNANFTIAGPLPVVTVTATDGSAAEAGTTTGMYRISRTGATVSSLSVSFTMGGSAQNGVDYNAITSPVTIPARASYVYVTLRPIDDSVQEGNETAILTISTDPNYVIGSSSSATITIQDND